MDATWLNILWHDVIGIILLWLMAVIWSQEGAELKRFARGWAGYLAPQRHQQARTESRAMPGLAHKPGCAECQAEAARLVEPAHPPPPWPQSKRGRK